VDLPPIELEKDPAPPPLKDSVAFQPTVEEVLASVAQDLTLQATACVREFGSFHLAVSGGVGMGLGLLERLCRELMTDPAYRMLPWRDTHVWTVDEAPVALQDPKSVYGVLRDLIIGHSGIPREQVHGMSAFRPAADTEYEKRLQRELGRRRAGHDRLDMVVLALGADGVAGRLPEERADEPQRLAVRLEDQSVTLTRRMLAGSRFMGVLAIGKDVSPVLQQVSAGAIRPVPNLLAGHTRWYVDHDAGLDGA
jgi:6-phosphogluconolactonase/glucosamine-6-phosphate isomerase/deaminase